MRQVKKARERAKESQKLTGESSDGSGAYDSSSSGGASPAAPAASALSAVHGRCDPSSATKKVNDDGGGGQSSGLTVVSIADDPRDHQVLDALIGVDAPAGDEESSRMHEANEIERSGLFLIRCLAG